MLTRAVNGFMGSSLEGGGAMRGLRLWLVIALLSALGIGAPTAGAASWQPQFAPGPGALNGVSCASASDCMAVGSRPAGSITLPLAERHHGTWTVVATPSPAGAQTSVLHAVSCPLTTTCMAVGSTTHGSDPHPLIERYANHVWKILPSPRVAGVLLGVSCTGPASCMAVGYQRSSASTLAELWNGSSWHLSSALSPGATFNELEGVSCVAGGTCEAVGTSDAAGSFAEGWNGGSWVLQPLDFTTGIDQLTGVSCALTTACIAVGSTICFNSVCTEAYGGDGTAWTSQSPQNPVPPGYPCGGLICGSNTFAAVSCPVAGWCLAVGQSLNDALGEVWDGSNWTVNSPQHSGGALNAVSCRGVFVCTAVGTRGSSPVVERLS